MDKTENSYIEYVYKTVDEKELKLSFLPPIKNEYEYAPIYFLIPGGGWHTCVKESMIDFSKTSVDILRNSGFAVVSIEYRTANDNIKINHILEDCFDAIGYLSTQKEKLKIDTDRIVVSGHSAGGHLALMLGYANGNLFTKNYDFNDSLAKVVVIAALSPATVLYDQPTKKNIGFGINYLFLNPNDLNERKSVSPIDCVNNSSPSTILFAGSADPLIYYESSLMLHKKLNENNVDSKLVISENAGHSFEKLKDSEEPTISFEAIQMELADFVLKRINN